MTDFAFLAAGAGAALAREATAFPSIMPAGTNVAFFFAGLSLGFQLLKYFSISSCVQGAG